MPIGSWEGDKQGSLCNIANGGVPLPRPFFQSGVLQCPQGSGLDCRCACSKAEGGGVVPGIGVQVLFTPGPGWYLALKPRASWDLVSINQPLSLLLRFQLWRLGNSPVVQVLAC